jgi:S1-C subfamily serine protease
MRPHVCGTIFCALLIAHASYPLQQDGVANIVKRSSDAVVLITISDSTGRETALGSGFLVSADGEVVTNLHVIKGASSATVKLSNGAFFPVAGVLASDATKDLAIIKVDGRNLPFLALADLDKVDVGEHVVAIGSPLGLEGTVSDGVISAIRDIGNRKLIQTTAPASHGNSRGPLLNMDNQVVGVVALGINPELGQNLNFAVPCSDVTALLLTARQKVKPLEITAGETETV